MGAGPSPAPSTAPTAPGRVGCYLRGCHRVGVTSRGATVWVPPRGCHRQGRAAQGGGCGGGETRPVPKGASEVAWQSSAWPDASDPCSPAPSPWGGSSGGVPVPRVLPPSSRLLAFAQRECPWVASGFWPAPSRAAGAPLTLSGGPPPRFLPPCPFHLSGVGSHEPPSAPAVLVARGG